MSNNSDMAREAFILEVLSLASWMSEMNKTEKCHEWNE